MARLSKSLKDRLPSYITKLEESVKESNIPNSQWIRENTFIFNKSTGRFDKFSFKNHEYQIDWVDSEAREVNIMKGCQVGATEIFVRLALALTANKRLTVILTQPDFKMSAGFSKSRIKPVIESSPKLKDLTSDSNSVDLKIINNGQLFIKYTKGAESHALSVPADVIISDEVDQSDQKNLKLFRSRLEHSSYQWIRNFGTPTIPKYGIHEHFSLGNYYSYAVKCPHCGHWNEFVADPDNPPIENLSHFLFDEFKENIPDFPAIYKEKLKELAEKCYICCSRCKKSLEYSDRLLVPSMSNKTTSVEPKFSWIKFGTMPKDVENYYITQIATGLKTGKQILKSMAGYFETRDIFNQTFGLPFVSSSDKLSATDMKYLEELEVKKPPFSFIGVDFGLKTHYVLLTIDTTDETTLVFKYGILPLFTPDDEMAVVNLLVDVMKKYNVIAGVVDAMPYQNSVSKLKKVAMQSGIPIVDAYFTDNARETKFNENTMTVRSGRTFQIDRMISDIKSGRTLFTRDILKRANKAEFVKHFEQFVRVKERDGSYTYPSQGRDHFGFAYMYAREAIELYKEHGLSGYATINSDLFSIGNVRVMDEE